MRNAQTHPVASTRPPSTDFHFQHDTEGSAKLSTTVTHALADVMNQDVSDAGFGLYDSIDPDALDRIFSSGSEDLGQLSSHVAFTVDGYRVTVFNTGEIVITPPHPSPRPTRRAPHS